MITKLAHQFSNYLVSQGAEASKQEVYAYSMEFVINLLISDFLLLLVGLAFGRLPAIVVWCVSYSALRVNIGGYHAPSHMLCITLGTLLGAGSILENWILMKLPGLIPLLLIFILLDILFLAPAVYERHPVTDRGKKTAKFRAFLVFIAGILVAALLYEQHSILSCSVVSGFANAMLLSVILSMKNIRHTNDFT